MKLLSDLKQAFILWCNKPVYSREKALEVTLKHILAKHVRWEDLSREDVVQLSELLPDVRRSYEHKM